MGFQAFINDVDPDADRLELPEPWRQGRTLYGGLSLALCLKAAQRRLDAPRPLRSALVGFLGPIGTRGHLEAASIRTGKNTASVRAKLSSELGPGSEITFVFAAPRESKVDFAPAGLPAGVTPPAPDASPFRLPAGAPNFVRSFEVLAAEGSAAPFSGAKPGASIRLWTRFKDPASRSGLLALMCMADFLPPGIAASLGEMAPMSTMTWLIDVLDDDLRTDDGWYLLENRPDHARNGYSSQDMSIWSTDGRQLVKGRQMVALFA